MWILKSYKFPLTTAHILYVLYQDLSVFVNFEFWLCKDYGKKYDLKSLNITTTAVGISPYGCLVIKQVLSCNFSLKHYMYKQRRSFIVNFARYLGLFICTISCVCIFFKFFISFLPLFTHSSACVSLCRKWKKIYIRSSASTCTATNVRTRLYDLSETRGLGLRAHK